MTSRIVLTEALAWGSVVGGFRQAIVWRIISMTRVKNSCYNEVSSIAVAQTIQQ